jgi:hypothetical protein
VGRSRDLWTPLAKSDLASCSCRALMNMNVESWGDSSGSELIEGGMFRFSIACIAWWTGRVCLVSDNSWIYKQVAE